jgi:transcriptional regulator with XRE-family HTH domain
MSIGKVGQFGYRVLGRRRGADRGTGGAAMVGKLIRARRLAKRMSQGDLAAAVGTSQRQITRWESYTTQMPREATRVKLGDVLGIAEAEWHLALAGHERPRPEPAAAPPDPPAPAREPDAPFDLARIIGYVEDYPDAAFRAQLARLEQQYPPEVYRAIVLRVFRSWGAKADLALVTPLAEGNPV